MKRFISKCVMFFFTMTLLFGALSLISRPLVKKQIADSMNGFVLDDTIKVLAIGDSHIGLSLNPQYIPESAIRFQLGEPYFYTEIRLKEYLKNNPQIKTVLLGLTYSNLDKNTDAQLLEESETRSFYFGKFFFLFENDEVFLLSDKSLVFFRNLIGWRLYIPTREIFKVMFQPIRFDGNYFAATQTKVSNYEKSYKKHFGSTESGFAEINSAYLHRIIRLCKEKNVQLILYSSPLYPKYYDLISKQHKTEYEETKADLWSKYGTPCWDYSSYLLPDSCFSDANHLNIYGAERISKEIAIQISTLK